MATETSAPLHVLFVDDDSDETYLFKEALEHLSLDIKVSRAVDGNDLISFLNNNPLPDLVFLDINMPYKDGTEALDEIRSEAKFDALPLVIYSTANNQNYIEFCFQKGANLYVIKPANFEGIMQVVKKVLSIDWRSNQKPTNFEKFVISA